MPCPNQAEARTAILTLLANRKTGVTICPSEAARMMAGKDADWRTLMPTIHAVTDAMIAEGEITISWKGTTLEKRDGPYRIAAAERAEQSR